MNNEMGSILQKANFALLLLIAAGLAYLIVRDRDPASEATSQRATLIEPQPGRPNGPVSDPAKPKTFSSFTPLRPPSATNPLRVLTGDTRVFPRNNTPSVNYAAQPRPEETGNVPAPQDDAAVPVGITTDVSRQRTDARISGRVILRGTPPPERAITLDAVCGRLHPAPMHTRHYVVGRDGGLANTFVYVKTGAPRDESPQASVPVLDNVNCEFQPYVLGVRARQPFTLRNSDPVLHNMHMMTKPGGGNREANLGMPVKGMSMTKVFDHPEIFIRVKCDVHPWMFAYIGVVAHRWFAVTDAEGTFSLPPGLPPGRYTIGAVHLKAGERTEQISLADGGSSPVTFLFDAPDGSAPQ